MTWKEFDLLSPLRRHKMPWKWRKQLVWAPELLSHNLGQIFGCQAEAAVTPSLWDTQPLISRLRLHRCPGLGRRNGPLCQTGSLRSSPSVSQSGGALDHHLRCSKKRKSEVMERTPWQIVIKYDNINSIGNSTKNWKWNLFWGPAPCCTPCGISSMPCSMVWWIERVEAMCQSMHSKWLLCVGKPSGAPKRRCWFLLMLFILGSPPLSRDVFAFMSLF